MSLHKPEFLRMDLKDKIVIDLIVKLYNCTNLSFNYLISFLIKLFKICHYDQIVVVLINSSLTTFE